MSKVGLVLQCAQCAQFYSATNRFRGGSDKTNGRSQDGSAESKVLGPAATANQKDGGTATATRMAAEQ